MNVFLILLLCTFVSLTIMLNIFIENEDFFLELVKDTELTKEAKNKSVSLLKPGFLLSNVMYFISGFIAAFLMQ